MEEDNSRRSIKNRILNIRGIALLAIICVGGIAGVLFLNDAINPYNDDRFDSVVWHVDDYSRMPMARDLIDRHLTTGMSESQVEQLLGAAESIITKPKDGGGNALQGHHTWTYFIGNDSFGVGDSVFVYVHFDASGNVVGSGIYGY